MKSIYYILLAVALLFVSSCEKEINFDGDETMPMQVLNSFVTHDSIVSVHLSRSNFFLNNHGFIPLNEATIKLFVNGELKENLTHTAEGKYQSSYQPKIDDIIRLESSSNGLKNISAETSILQKPIIASLDTTMNLTSVYPTSEINENGIVITNLNRKIYDVVCKITIHDTDLNENYYFLSVVHRITMGEEELLSRKIILPLNDIVYDNANGSIIFDGDDDEYRKINIFPDILFNGKQYTLTFNVPVELINFADDYTPTPEEMDNMEFMNNYIETSLNQVSKDYYLYALSRKMHENTDEDLFVEPVRIHSNIHNGIGILGSFSTDKKIIYVPHDK